jgi:hypothetical protein
MKNRFEIGFRDGLREEGVLSGHLVNYFAYFATRYVAMRLEGLCGN